MSETSLSGVAPSSSVWLSVAEPVALHTSPPHPPYCVHMSVPYACPVNRFIHTMEYRSAIQRDKIGSFVEMWMNLESVMQSEVSQKEENKYIFMNICGI